MKISVSYANHLWALIRKRGEFTHEELFFNVDESILENESNLLNFSQILPLIEKLKALYPQKCVGLYVGHSQTLSTWGRAGFAILTRKTLYDAISVGLKYQRATVMLVNLKYKFIDNRHSEVLIKAIPGNEDSLAFCFESTLASLLSIYTQLTNQTINVLSIDVGYELSTQSIAEYNNYFACEINLNCKETVVHFELPENTNMAMFDIANSKMFLQQLIERNDEIKSDNLIYNIKSKISRGDGKFYSQTQISDEFNMSTSLLSKRLSELDISYRELLDAAKQKVAIKHLTSSHQMKMFEVAFLSGYSDLSNFRKAFLRWQGMSPSDFKKIHMNKD